MNEYITANVSQAFLLAGLAAVAAAWMGLVVWSLVSVFTESRAAAEKGLWLLAVVGLPFLGPLAWFTLGRPHALRTNGAGSTDSRVLSIESLVTA